MTKFLEKLFHKHEWVNISCAPDRIVLECQVCGKLKSYDAKTELDKLIYKD